MHYILFVITECRESVLLSFLMIPVPFIALDIFSLIWLLKFRLSFKDNPKCFCQLAQTTGALLKRFLDEICLVSWKMSLPEYVLNQDWKIFPTYKPTQIFFVDFISSFTEMLLSFKTEINDMSSAKSFTVYSKLPDKSININNEKNGRRMDSCGTPVLTGNHLDLWPSSSTLWNLLINKLLIRCNRQMVTSADLSLNIIFRIRLYQKPKKYQEMRHQPQENGKHQKLCISYVLLTKPDLHMSHLIKRQIHGLIDNGFLSPRLLYILKINLLNIFPQTANKQTSR